jgi:hypothetical protein
MDSTDGIYFDGLVAEAAIWNVALTAADVAMLNKGYSPMMVRPSALLAYWPLMGRYPTELDLFGGFPLTLTNSPAQAAHPRIIYPARPQLYVPAAAAPPAGGLAPKAFHHRHLMGA